MLPVTEEDKARENIERLLIAPGWQVFDADKANIMAGRGVAIREFHIQRMYSMLKGKDLPEDLEEELVNQLGGLFKQPGSSPALCLESP